MTLTAAPTTVWPGLAPVPEGALSARIAERLFRSAVARRRITVRLHQPDGTVEELGLGGPAIVVHRPAELFARVGRDKLIGFGEAYLTGAWTEDGVPGDGVLGDFLAVLAADMADLVPRSLQRLRAVVSPRLPRSQRGTRENTRANVAHHYDLSNDLFAAFLDPTLSYSSALFEDPDTALVEDYAAAQRRKIDRLLDRAAVGPGTRLLEIGTGWGELAIRAARRGADVTSLTISVEQADLARERIAAADLSDHAHVLLQDYRETQGRYDAVVSVEMIEAVGANHWEEYFGTIDRVLEPGGRVGLQAILQDDDTVRATRDTYTWIRKYIFPGGQLASVEAIERVLARATSLHVADRYAFGRHYAETLRRWRQRFEARAADVAALGFDETFRRMWSLYLAYSEAGFRTGYLDVAQFTLTKPAH